MCYEEIKKPLSDQDPCVAFCRGGNHVPECIRTCHKRGYFDYTLAFPVPSPQVTLISHPLCYYPLQ
ncbi:hypothetical protein AKO1_002804 [Acrasis kona]|uniref:Uncharacterized protein n=1 Tax=Acrasis kona TaxID=1008807 RepID=A0AAW2YTW5_9EUKA